MTILINDEDISMSHDPSVTLEDIEVMIAFIQQCDLPSVEADIEFYRTQGGPEGPYTENLLSGALSARNRLLVELDTFKRRRFAILNDLPHTLTEDGLTFHNRDDEVLCRVSI